MKDLQMQSLSSSDFFKNRKLKYPKTINQHYNVNSFFLLVIIVIKILKNKQKEKE
jgi:hypothetical protein